MSVVLQSRETSTLWGASEGFREHLDVNEMDEFFLVTSSGGNCTSDCRGRYFDFIPVEKFHHFSAQEIVCGRRPCEISTWHLQQLVPLAIADRTTADHLLLVDKDIIPVNTISVATLLDARNFSFMLQKNCAIHDPRWLTEWEFWKSEYLFALDLFSADEKFRPPKGSCAIAAPVPFTASTVVLRDLVATLKKTLVTNGVWYEWLIRKNQFTLMALYNSFILLGWSTYGAVHTVDDVVRTLRIPRPKGVTFVEALQDDDEAQGLLLKHAEFIAASWKGHGATDTALFLDCHETNAKVDLKAAQCFDIARLVRAAASASSSQKEEPERTAWSGGKGRTAAAEVRMASFYASLRNPAECPGRLGIAINTGDATESMDRVRYAISPHGWAGTFAAEKNDSRGVPVVVYSNKISACVPSTNGSCIPIRPCCDGKDLDKSLAMAQAMREHTWAKMLRDLPGDTYWFVSTEDDVWWNIDGLCDVTAEIVADLGVPSSTPILLGGGAPPEFAIFGGLVVMNRPLLEMFANPNLLSECRADLLTKGNPNFKQWAYAGAPYNNDHLISHCAFDYFPRFKNGSSDVAHRIFLPMFFADTLRPRYFYQNGDSWASSKRAQDFVNLLYPDERIIAFHHASTYDMLFLQDSMRLANRSR